MGDMAADAIGGRLRTHQFVVAVPVVDRNSIQNISWLQCISARDHVIRHTLSSLKSGDVCSLT